MSPEHKRFYEPIEPGNCLDHVVKMVRLCLEKENERENMWLCQGRWSTGSLHCWIERFDPRCDGMVAIDLTTQGQAWEREFYYTSVFVNPIDQTSVQRYTFSEVVEFMKKTGEYCGQFWNISGRVKDDTGQLRWMDVA
jgi:hypothetical protein